MGLYVSIAQGRISGTGFGLKLFRRTLDLGAPVILSQTNRCRTTSVATFVELRSSCSSCSPCSPSGQNGLVMAFRGKGNGWNGGSGYSDGMPGCSSPLTDWRLKVVEIYELERRVSQESDGGLEQQIVPRQDARRSEQQREIADRGDKRQRSPCTTSTWGKE